MPVRVLLADDHRLMREGTAALLGADERIEVIGLARDGREVLALAERRRPDVVLLDLHMPVVDGLGGLEGVVSRGDLLKVFLRGDEDIAEEVRREVVARLFHASPAAVRVEVREGVVTLSGRVRDTALVPVAARLARGVEGVVDVGFDLTGPESHP